MKRSEFRRVNVLFEKLADEPESRWKEVLGGEDERIAARVLAMLRADSADDDSIQRSIADASGLLVTDPRQVGPFRVVRRVGEGGMGRVYEAIRKDVDFEQRIALKILRVAGASAVFAERLRQEQQVLARLNHPHIARMVDGGSLDDGTPYVAMEFVSGQSLTDYVDANILDLGSCLDLFSQLCDAVGYAHQNLVVHRDLKPENVLVDERGDVKLLDFGIAKLLGPDSEAVGTLTRAGAMSPAFAAPEQITGEGISTLTDVYALGVLLFQLVTGKLPFDVDQSSSALELERRICESDPPRPSDVTQRFRGAELKGDLDTIITKCLAKQPQRRYESARALADDITRYTKGEAVAARPDSFTYRAGKFLKRNALATAFSAVLITTLLASATIASWQALQIAKQRDLAEHEADASQQVADFMLDLFRVSDPRERGQKDLSARDLLDRAAASVANEVEAAPLIKARLMHTLGLAYANTGDYETGMNLLEQALELRRAHGGSAEVSDSLNRIGNIHRLYDRLDLAEPPLMQALMMREKGPRNAELADAYNNMGLLQYQMGHYQEAESLLRDSIALHAQLTSPNDPSVVSPHHNLALTLRHLGRFEEAREAINVKLEINRATNLDGTASYANSLAVLGRIERELGAFADALAHAEASLALRRQIYPDGHPGLASGLHGAALIAMDVGQHQRALALLREGLAVASDVSGPESAMASRMHHGLGIWHWRNGEHDQAIASMQIAVGLRSRQLDKDNPTLWESQLALAAMVNVEQSEEILMDLMPRMSSKLQEDHAFRMLGRLLQAKNTPETTGAESARSLLETLAASGGTDFRSLHVSAHARKLLGETDALDALSARFPMVDDATLYSLI